MWGHQDFRVRTENQEHKVSPDPRAPPARLVSQEAPEDLVLLDFQDPQDFLGDRDPQEAPEPEASRDRQDHQAEMDCQVRNAQALGANSFLSFDTTIL